MNAELTLVPRSVGRDPAVTPERFVERPIGLVAILDAQALPEGVEGITRAAWSTDRQIELTRGAGAIVLHTSEVTRPMRTADGRTHRSTDLVLDDVRQIRIPRDDATGSDAGRSRA